jgi:hypothetical protein
VQDYLKPLILKNRAKSQILLFKYGGVSKSEKESSSLYLEAFDAYTSKRIAALSGKWNTQ